MDYKEWAVGVESLKAAFKASENRFSSIEHLIEGVWTGKWDLGDVVSVEAKVRYELPNKKEPSLPACFEVYL